MANRFAGQVVIVTGGSRGIGRAIVERFAAEDAQVISVGVNADKAERLPKRSRARPYSWPRPRAIGAPVR